MAKFLYILAKDSWSFEALQKTGINRCALWLWRNEKAMFNRKSFFALVALLGLAWLAISCDPGKDKSEGGEGILDCTDSLSYDADGDGFMTTACTDGTDCDDTDAMINPGVDVDGDGYYACGDDCDDTNANINRGVDNDGDGDSICTDCDDADPTLYTDVDADGDGYADLFCGGDDCDDTNAAINPDAEEVCNDQDDDCDGYVDCHWMRTGLGDPAAEECMPLDCSGPHITPRG